MGDRRVGSALKRVAMGGVACLGLVGSPTYSQQWPGPGPAPTGQSTLPGPPQGGYGTGGTGGTGGAGAAYGPGEAGPTAAAPTLPPAIDNMLAAPPPAPAAAGAGPSFASALAAGEFGAGGGSTYAIADNVGYIDSAIIRSRVRVRYDAAYNLNSPDMAEFFYAKCGCFANISNFPQYVTAGGGAAGLRAAKAAGYDPRARGPQHAAVVTGRPIDKFGGDPRIDYQEQATYLEYAPIRNFSTFVEVPVRFINPTLVRNFYGFSDLNAGFKYAFVAEPDRFLTFQFRAYAPTGAADRGLGTGHVSFEPALLVFRRLTDRLYFSGEFRDWIPIGGSDFAGNVLRYGAGLTYNVVLTDHFRIAPVNEVVGWTILSGKQIVPTTPDPVSVSGHTMVNEKIGVRIGLGDYSNPGGGSALNDRHSFYVGYGHAVTGDHWYKDVIRVEYNYYF